jgi:carbon starvation protein CstA
MIIDGFFVTYFSIQNAEKIYGGMLMKQFVMVYVIAVSMALSMAVVFSTETPQAVKNSGSITVGENNDRNSSYVRFLDTFIVDNHANRIKLEAYRKQLNSLAARINKYMADIKKEHSISSRAPNVELLNTLREEMQVLVTEHENLTKEVEGWVASIPSA